MIKEKEIIKSKMEILKFKNTVTEIKTHQKDSTIGFNQLKKELTNLKTDQQRVCNLRTKITSNEKMNRDSENGVHH